MEKRHADKKCMCLHCVTVVLDVFPKILKKLLEKSKIFPQPLFEKIQIDFDFKKKLIASDHVTIKTLLTDGFTKLDVTLMCKIIAHFFYLLSITPPTRGWGSNPQANETTIGDDVQRIRIIRNHFFHKVETASTKEEFKDFFEKVEGICSRIDNHLNLRGYESLTTLLQSKSSPPWEKQHEIEDQYIEQKSLKEFMNVQIGTTNFKIYQTGIFKEVIQKLKTDSDDVEEKMLITWTFPQIHDPKVAEQINEELNEINNSLDKLKLTRATQGSLVLEISVYKSLLLNDKEFRQELETFLIRILSQKNLKCLFQSTDIVMSEGLYTETSLDDRPNTGGLKLHLEVDQTTFNSDEAFKNEIQHLLQNVSLRSNGSQIFKSDTVTAVMEQDSEESKKGHKACYSCLEKDHIIELKDIETSVLKQRLDNCMKLLQRNEPISVGTTTELDVETESSDNLIRRLIDDNSFSKNQAFPNVNVHQSDLQISAKAGETVTIVCSVTGQPPVTNVYWERYINGHSTIIKSDTNTKKYSGSTPNTPSLTIFNVDADDVGRYCCHAYNSFGTTIGDSKYLNVAVPESRENNSNTNRDVGNALAEAAFVAGSTMIAGPLGFAASSAVIGLSRLWKK